LFVFEQVPGQSFSLFDLPQDTVDLIGCSFEVLDHRCDFDAVCGEGFLQFQRHAIQLFREQAEITDAAAQSRGIRSDKDVEGIHGIERPAGNSAKVPNRIGQVSQALIGKKARVQALHCIAQLDHRPAESIHQSVRGLGYLGDVKSLLDRHDISVCPKAGMLELVGRARAYRNITISKKTDCGDAEDRVIRDFVFIINTRNMVTLLPSGASLISLTLPTLTPAIKTPAPGMIPPALRASRYNL